MSHLLVQEDELEVEAGPEHEHNGVHLDLGDGVGRQGVGDGHEAQVLVGGGGGVDPLLAAAVRLLLLDLEIAPAVDHLVGKKSSLH